MNKPTSTTTNGEFGLAIGVSHSMASRIRSGDRLPGTRVLWRIHKVYDVPLVELLVAYESGPKEFGRLIRARLETKAVGA